MRPFILALAVLCAILSGWTSAVAQAQGLAHRDGIAVAHDAVSSHSEAPACASGCPHPAKGAHPMLCSACFALEVAASDLGRLAVPVQRVRPVAELPLVASAPQPAAPPPKAALST